MKSSKAKTKTDIAFYIFWLVCFLIALVLVLSAALLGAFA